MRSAKNCSSVGRAVHAALQQLESRRLLAFSSYDGGTFSIEGTAKADTILVQRVGRTLKATLNGKTESATVATDDEPFVFILVFPHEGNDTVTVTADYRTQIVGGPGNDRINGGPNEDILYGDEDGGEGNDTIYGNGGADEIYDGLGSDSVDGGSGDDQLYADAGRSGGHDGSDTYVGGSGLDTVDYRFRTLDPVNVTLDGKKNDGAAGEYDWIKADVENVSGSRLTDTLTGNDGPNQINGDEFFLGYGTDFDSVFGRGGDDSLFGYRVDPGLGNDDVYGLIIDYSQRTVPLTFNLSGVANDTEDPTFLGGQAGETDSLYVRTRVGPTRLGTTQILLGTAADKFTNAYRVEVHGGAGGDTLTSQSQSYNRTTLFGEGGDDKITAGYATVVNGGAGKDTLGGNVDGRNELDYSDVIDLPVAISYDGNPDNDGPDGEGDHVTVEGFQKVSTGSGYDTLIGNGGVQIFSGGAGDDLLDGRGGDDVLFGDDGDSLGVFADTLIGGTGNDRITGGPGNETLIGGTGRDTIDGGAGDDSILGDDGDDQLNGDYGRDTVRGGAGRDLVVGGLGKDTLYGDAGNDVLSAIDGSVDVLDGGTYTDVALADKGTVKDQIFAVESVL